MRPSYTKLTPVAGLPKPLMRHAFHAAGGMCFLVANQQLFAFAPREGRILWRHDEPRPAPTFYRVPRRASTSGKQLWSGASVLVHLFDTGDGVRLVAYEPTTKKRIWHADIATPPPATWTERECAWPDAKTEEIDAFLADSDELVLVLDRRSRRSMRWPDIKAPERRSQLDLFGFRADTGAVTWQRSIEGVEVPILDKECLDLVLRTPDGIATVSSRSGDLRFVMPARKGQSWPRRVTSDIYASWRNGSRVGVDRVSSDGVRSGEWARKGTRESHLARVADRVFFRANETFICGLGDDMRAAWEARVRTFVYGMALVRGEGLVVGTTGAHAGVYALSSNDGALIATVPIKHGVWSVGTAPTGAGVLLCTGEGILAWDPRGGPPERLAATSGYFVGGGVGEGSVVVCAEPEAGIFYVEGV